MQCRYMWEIVFEVILDSAVHTVDGGFFLTKITVYQTGQRMYYPNSRLSADWHFSDPETLARFRICRRTQKPAEYFYGWVGTL